MKKVMQAGNFVLLLSCSMGLAAGFRSSARCPAAFGLGILVPRLPGQKLTQ
jgi:hypothetical protein